MSGDSAPRGAPGPSVAIVGDAGKPRARVRALLRSAGIEESAAADAAVVVACSRKLRAAEVDVIRDLQRSDPTRGIVVVCDADDAVFVRRAIEAGAAGFVVSERIDSALLAAVTTVGSGQMSLPATFARQIAKPTFTTREKQILGLVVMGLSNGEIGRRLYLAESTVKSHLSSAFTKLGVRSRNEATAMILDPGSGLGPGILRVSEEIKVKTQIPTRLG
jgi:DNA-binding NarL/FixJ family response regulator